MSSALAPASKRYQYTRWSKSKVGKPIGASRVRRHDGPGGKLRTRKATPDELRSIAEACKRSQDASDEIRKGAGLEPIAPNQYRVELERLIVEVEAKVAAKPKRKAPPAKARTVITPQGMESGFKPSPQVFRMSGAELRALDTDETRAEIARRKAKRAVAV